MSAGEFELKPLRPESIEGALKKAERYRLLNEPWQAESICLDILAIDGNNQAALATLLLAITDQFGRGLEGRVGEARSVLERLTGAYERAYYAGIIAERRANHQLRKRLPQSGEAAYQLFREAMQRYEEAERLSPPGNDSAILRWNTCARRLQRNPSIRPGEDRVDDVPPTLGE